MQRRNQKQRQLTIIPQIIQNPLYRIAKDNYQEYFMNFQDKMNTVCEKENYRIYLQEKAAQKMLEKLINEKRQFQNEIETQKHKNNSANHCLMGQIKTLENLQTEYRRIKDKYENIASKHKQVIDQKREQNLEVEGLIKNRWKCIHPITIDNVTSSIKNHSKLNHVPKSLDFSHSRESSLQSSRFPSIYEYLKVNKKMSKEKLNNKFEIRKEEKYLEFIQHERQKLDILKLFSGFLKRKLQYQQPLSSVAALFPDIDLSNLLRNLNENISVKKNFLIEMTSITNTH